MFATLIESRAVHPRRTGGSIASVIFHGGLITAAFGATARQVDLAPPADRVMHVVFQPRDVAPRQPAPRPAAGSVAKVPAGPTTLRFVIPSIAPVGIPAVDFSVDRMPTDFSTGARAFLVASCSVNCAATPGIDGAGREMLSGGDLMLRLVEEPVAPRYPESLRRAGVEGSVVVRFVVDTTGRVDMSSVETMQSTHPAFSTAVRETLSRLKFRASLHGDRKVSALAVMPFQFTLR